MSKKLQLWLVIFGVLAIVGVVLWLSWSKLPTVPGRELTIEERNRLLESLAARAASPAAEKELTPAEREAALRALQETAPLPGRELTPQEREQILKSIKNRSY